MSNAKNEKYWPNDVYRDNHKTCLNFYNLDNEQDSSIIYNVPAGFNRFQTHVGMAGAGENPVGMLSYEIWLDNKFAARVDCEGEPASSKRCEQQAKRSELVTTSVQTRIRASTN